MRELRQQGGCRERPLRQLATLQLVMGACVSLLLLGRPGWPAERSGGGERTMECTEGPEKEGPIAELTFASPQPFVIVVEAPRGERRLYAMGESVAPLSGVGSGVRILQVESGRIKVRPSGSLATFWLVPGDPLPGRPDRVIAATPRLSGLTFQYRVTEGSRDSEPRLLCLRASRAHLVVSVPAPQEEVQVLGVERSPIPPAVARTTVERFLRQKPEAGAPVVEMAPHTYEVSAKDLRDLFDRAERVVAEAWMGGWLSGPTPGRASQAIESPIADGALEPKGFRLMSAKWAEAAGLETGDLILAVDGRAVNSFDDLYQAYQQVRRSVRRPRFEVTLERNGEQVTKTYLIK